MKYPEINKFPKSLKQRPKRARIIKDELYYRDNKRHEERTKTERETVERMILSKEVVTVTPVELRELPRCELICRSKAFNTPIVVHVEDFIPAHINSYGYSRDIYLREHLPGDCEVIFTGLLEDKVLASRILALDKRIKACYFDRPALTRYEENTIVTAKVSAVLRHSLFVEVGGMETEITEHEIAATPLPDLRRLYKIGDLIKVLICSLKRNDTTHSVEKIVVSKRRAEVKKFTKTVLSYRPGMIVTGEVIKNIDRGCLVYLDSGLTILGAINRDLPRPLIGEEVVVEINTVNTKKLRVYGKLISKSFLKNF